MDVLAVVGSRHWPEASVWDSASELIDALYTARTPDLVVSGGAPGIDTLAVRLAHDRQIPYRELAPRNHRWEPAGYKERNVQVAELCTRLAVIRHAGSKSFGSGWTAEYAVRIGKPAIGWILYSDGRIETYLPGDAQLPADVLF